MLPASERLRANPLFRGVFASGRSFADPLLVLHVKALPETPDARQTGFSVSKKVGKAAVRNRTKRRLRHLVRALLPELSRGHHVVIVARAKAAEASTAELEAALRKAYGRAGLLGADGV